MNSGGHLFPYEWRLADGFPAKGIEAHGSTVFGTFVCGGGSTMGYKLAGYHHLGGVEIDANTAKDYEANLHPEHLFVEDLREFNKRDDLPEELYHLDLLDGSPPCSTFSLAGKREQGWGKEKRFAEGQKKQVLDDLVFVYVDTILKLKPKCFLLENVKGIISGNARAYCRKIVDTLVAGGYEMQMFCLNGATMGVPQSRTRVFFVGHRRELTLPRLVLDFHEKEILFGEIADMEGERAKMSPREERLWANRKYGDTDFGCVSMRLRGKPTFFNSCFLYKNKVVPAVTAQAANGQYFYHFDHPWKINDTEIKRASSFPADYVAEHKTIGWLAGMSVPPVMTAQIAYQIWEQWLRPLRA